MANQADAHPDSDPSGPGDSFEQGSLGKYPARKGIADDPGDFAGTAGTGGKNKVQDQSFER